MNLTHLLESILLTRLLILRAIIRRVLIKAGLGIGFGVVDDLIEEGVGVELEDGGVGVFEGEVGREGGEAGVPVGDGAGRDGVAPFAGEGQAVERGDVEEEEVAGAGGVELLCGNGQLILFPRFEIGNGDGGRAHLLEQECINGKQTPIDLSAIVLGKRLIRASSDIVDTVKRSEQAIRRIPSRGASVVRDAIMWHEVLMIETDEAIHRSAVAGHVVGLDGAAVVGHCEVMDPFLVDGRGLW